MQADAILIDGRSGSGKTALAVQIAAVTPGAQLVRLDDLYPGWHGLAAGSAAVPVILSTFRWQEWDWAASGPGRWHALNPERPIIVEGVGAISRASRALASIAIWVELDDTRRKSRALERDGAMFAQHWEHWAQQECDFIEREHPTRLANVVVELA